MTEQRITKKTRVATDTLKRPATESRVCVWGGGSHFIILLQPTGA